MKNLIFKNLLLAVKVKLNNGMYLKEITINNFRSIKEVSTKIEKVNDSHTYSLIGINESGKSSFLEAIQLYQGSNIDYPKDYYNTDKAVTLNLYYTPTRKEKEEFQKTLLKKYKLPKELVKEIDVKSVKFTIEYEASTNNGAKYYQDLELEKTLFDEYTLQEDDVIKRTKEDEELLDFNHYANKDIEYWWLKSHYVTFWKSSEKYLIMDGIDLETFAKNPNSTSVPLVNCFKLAGINKENISNTLSQLKNPVQIRNLQEKLSEAVTKHINLIWPEHEIKVVFLINNGKISFLIEDQGIKFKAKTVDQRSDGFRQFISFLLTISVENSKEELRDTILLIDEPETHLHPKAQINMLRELIDFTTNSRNNIVFFATHSIYLIDKSNIDRCIKVSKENNASTVLSRIDKTSSSFSEINYEVFDIATNDYHNELYGYLMDRKRSSLNKLEKDRMCINELTNKKEKVSLPTYIRHSIHHPENSSNRKVREDSLRKSIRLMREMKYSNTKAK